MAWNSINFSSSGTIVLKLRATKLKETRSFVSLTSINDKRNKLKQINPQTLAPAAKLALLFHYNTLQKFQIVGLIF